MTKPQAGLYTLVCMAMVLAGAAVLGSVLPLGLAILTAVLFGLTAIGSVGYYVNSKIRD